MGRRQRRHEEHVNHEGWAIPYGDLITLLLAFFVVMYAISSVNAGKYRILSDSLYAAFRGTPRTLEPVQAGEKQVGSAADMHTAVVPQPTQHGEPHALLGRGGAAQPVHNTVLAEGVTARGAALSQASAALDKVADRVEEAMQDLIRRDVVTIRRNDLWIEVEIRADILFPSGSAQLSPNAAGVIEQLAGVLAGLPNAVRVEGHTDNVPIRTSVFYSNWELSAARAGSVVRMLAGHNVAPGRLAVVGLGQEHPAQTNDTPEGRNANRRVVVVILSTALTDPDSQVHDTPRQQVVPAALPAPLPAAAGPGPGPATGTDHAT
jgi:chemotaxis protein MotB